MENIVDKEMSTRANLAYLKYVLRHKRHVVTACRITGVSFWRSLIHDWHKFLPSEWGPYVRAFYRSDGSKQYVESPEFAIAWNLHQKRGRHHWQHWLLTWDRGDTEALPMPDHFLREMVADWWGAGKTITGRWSADQWYEKNKEKIKLHSSTRTAVEALLKSNRNLIDRSERLGFGL
jgi:hypothetical protein